MNTQGAVATTTVSLVAWLLTGRAMPISGVCSDGTALNTRILDLIATVIEYCEPPHTPAPGHPPMQTVRMLATLRRFLREGMPWRSLRARKGQASGSTLRRALGAHGLAAEGASASCGHTTR